MTKNTKTARFELRLSPEEKEVMEQIARVRGVSLSGFLREQVRAAAQAEGNLMAA